MQDLIAVIAHGYPSARFEISPLPTGVCFLWLELNGRAFVMESDPKGWAGVSENFPDTPPFVGHDEVFDSLDAGIQRFKSYLAEAARAASVPEPCVLHDKPTLK
jgi:hypothetical protein